MMEWRGVEARGDGMEMEKEQRNKKGETTRKVSEKRIS